ncbi:MAG: histidinol-phosphatase [Alphaproteobacteria bacterium]|nr:histidinol-phosphatase [Alphaproteobacteria bacterium]
MDLDPFVSLAGRLADAAGKVIRPYFRSGIEVIGKADTSPVTIADRESETAMRALIEREFPQHGILGEEHGAVRMDAEHVWVLDPIDGTKSFISGFPLFGTLIALLHRGRPVVGIIDQPIIGERWIGAEGRPTTFKGKPAHTRKCAKPGDATLYSTSPDMFKGPDAPGYDKLRQAVKLPRFGGDCYAYGQLANGHVDIVVEARLQPYDYLAQVPIIEGAGGTFTDWKGKPLGLDSDGRVCAVGDPQLHKDVLRLLAG